MARTDYEFDTRVQNIENLLGNTQTLIKSLENGTDIDIRVLDSLKYMNEAVVNIHAIVMQMAGRRM